MTKVMEANNLYLADFERFEKAGHTANPVLHRLHKAAIARFSEQGFPGPRDEDWRFTSVASLLKAPFELAPANADSRPRWQHEGALPAGVILTTLSEALQSHPDLVTAHLARYADYRTHAFAALNAAFLREGVFLYVPRGVRVEQPILISYPTPPASRPLVHYRRGLVVLETNSEARLVETYSGPPGQTSCVNAVTEVVVGENAGLDYYKVQEEGEAAYHLATLQVQQARSSRFRSHAITLGGGFVRNEINAVLGDEGCECTLNGLYLAGSDQLVATLTMIDHAKPHCVSHELYKGILDGKGRGVFNGKIFVRQDAQKTDAKQTNQTLLLSDDATINTKPQLEIYADDVKCTHGATVGQLSAEGLFYLRSRGIGADEARNLLTYAFANDILGRIQVEAVRARLERFLLEARRLPPADLMEEDA